MLSSDKPLLLFKFNLYNINRNIIKRIAHQGES
jgi:hypothetical protein